MKAKFTLNRRPWIAVAHVLGMTVLLSASVSAQASSSQLPDNRAYEMVTPVAKNGLDALGSPEVARAASSGDAIMFFATGALPGSLGANSPDPTYIAVRGASGWTTHGMLPPDRSGSEQHALPAGFFPDLSTVFVDSALPLAPGGTAGQYSIYAQDTATGAYQQFISDPTLSFALAAGTPDDSHFIFEDESQLLPQATADTRNLYESSNGHISLVGILPTVEGGGAPAGGSRIPAGFHEEAYTQTNHALSDNGSTVFFREPNSENLYVREHADAANANTTQIDKSVGGAGEFRTASANGSRAFFTKAGDLYVYDVTTGNTTDLAPSGSVDGVLGDSEDGSYVYFAADAVLTEGAVAGQSNLYESHNDGTGWTTTYVATLPGATSGARRVNATNWETTSFEAGLGFALPGGGDPGARLTPDGKMLLFTTTESITGYDSRGYSELYLYNATARHITCVSCDPSGKPGQAETKLEASAVGGLEGTPNTNELFPHVPANNLSDDGSRVFFETAQPLLPQDTNDVSDVYEWERAGSGSCASAGGCLYLISTGYGSEPSYFAGASANGSDVFIFTLQQLVSQDQDELQDIYDARVNGGVPQVAAPACTGTGCQGAPPAPPAFATPPTATFNGMGNFPPSTSQTKKKTVKCTRGKKLNHGKCVKPKPKRKAKAAAKGRNHA